MDRINELIRKLQKAEELLLLGNITDTDYQRIKQDGEIEINILGDRITNAQRSAGNIDRYTKQMAGYLARLNELFGIANANTRGKVINCLLPGMLTFNALGFQPAKLNEAVRIIYNCDFAFRRKP